jgi:hypothetical protein
VAAVLVVCTLLVGCRSGSRQRAGSGPTAIVLPTGPAPGTGAPGARFPVSIHRANPGLSVATGRTSASGQAGRVLCATCHAGLAARAVEPGSAAPAPARFHTGIELRHGAKTCRTCHRPPGFESFHLADGEPVDPANVMRLCGQCHATRLREYEAGAHGGMSGYWDLGRGPRVRNHCLDCHDPHAPKVPQVIPAPRSEGFGVR